MVWAGMQGAVFGWTVACGSFVVSQWVTKEIANPGISIAKLKHVETWSSQALDAFNIEIIFPWWVVTGSIQELDVLNIERILLLVVIPLVDSHKESSSA